MVYCGHCHRDKSEYDPEIGFIVCKACGRVLDDTLYDYGPQFIQLPDGQKTVSGKNIDIETGHSVSYDRSIKKARYEIEQIVNNLHVGGGDTIITMAHRYYVIAHDYNFTRGRRTTHVVAACLYIACRQIEKPYLLIDFSDYLQISVYVLGAVFLQLCNVLLLSDHPFFQKLIDPSLFIRRFTECLRVQRDKAKAVSYTAVKIVASMKRDWMQTGRKPSGICGAALYIAALSHGLDYTKADVVAVVHVCETTLTKRLIEFENTDSGGLTIDELEEAYELTQVPSTKDSPESGETLCKHKNKGARHYCHGLCEECYHEFNKLSGGLEGGADPPSFQRAEKLRLDATKRATEAAPDEEAALGESFHDTNHSQTGNIISSPTKDIGDVSSKISFPEVANDSVLSALRENGKDDPDPESHSDIDDLEVEGYINNEEEARYKKVIWEEMNKEYLEEKAAKEALAAELAARGLGMEEGKKKKQRRKANDMTTAGTPAEATCDMLKRKRLKINKDAVGRLYNTRDDDDDDDDANKKNVMDFDGEFAEVNGDGETLDHGYDYPNHNYYDD